MIVLVVAVIFLVWSSRVRLQRIDYVSGLVGGGAQTVDVHSPTGYFNAQRDVIVPGRNERNFDWIAQTQQMFAGGRSRIRHVDYDNAPQGRAVNTTSPYRWWLGGLAWLDQVIDFVGRKGCPGCPA